MQKHFALVLFAALIAFATPAHASWQTDLQAAITAGNVDQINAVAAANPDQHAGIAMALLQAGKNLLATNPTLATKLYQAAAPYASQIPAGQAATAAGYISAFVNVAKDPAFQDAHPTEASKIFSTSLVLASLPNIVAADPDLYSITLAEANEFLDRKPVENAAVTDLENQVLLAQQQGAPGNNLTGPQNPNENQNEGDDEGEGSPSSAQ